MLLLNTAAANQLANQVQDSMRIVKDIVTVLLTGNQNECLVLYYKCCTLNNEFRDEIIILCGL